MTRHVKAKREEIQHKKNRGLITQFIIFLILRSIDIGASLAVLSNAWQHKTQWKNLNYTLLNTTKKEPEHSSPGSSNHRKIIPRNINPVAESFNFRNVNHTTSQPSNFGPPRINPRISYPRRNDSRNFFIPGNSHLREAIPQRFNLRETDPRENEPLNMKRRSIIYRRNDYTVEYCRSAGQWEKKTLDSKISKYQIILGLTLFFNLLSMTMFLIHLGFWIVTLQISFREGVEYNTRVTRLTRNSLLSLITPVFREVPLSCLNVELLALRSGHAGLVCAACTFTSKCKELDYVENSLKHSKLLLGFDYSIMLANSLWKGVSGFYRLIRFEEFHIYFIRACASIVFGLLYSIAAFTPAMFMFIYRYFAIPGLDAPFLHDMADRLAVIGATIWVALGSVCLCCPILYAIRLNAD